jgi:hypothetical protein
MTKHLRDARVCTQLLYLCYLTTLSVLRLNSVSDRMINECGAVGGIRIGRGNQSSSR